MGSALDLEPGHLSVVSVQKLVDCDLGRVTLSLRTSFVSSVEALMCSGYLIPHMKTWIICIEKGLRKC